MYVCYVLQDAMESFKIRGTTFLQQNLTRPAGRCAFRLPPEDLELGECKGQTKLQIVPATYQYLDVIANTRPDTAIPGQHDKIWKQLTVSELLKEKKNPQAKLVVNLLRVDYEITLSLEKSLIDLFMSTSEGY